MAFLGEEKALEITVTNTNIIADSIEALVPLPNTHLYTPTIENCEEKLRNLCYGNAKKLSGDPIPEVIQKRLDTELDGIISNGYSVIYYIARQIVKKANDDGYLVGSRGSVGSSFVATMSEVTEVNPLPPHYICPSCHKLEWTSETYPDIKSGYDLPSKKCPNCGTTMIHDGQNIPFETFLGFKAEKTPDIDLNFPGDYQSRAHDYTKELLGEQNVFRAGTIETVKEQTAFGYARGYFERLGLDPDTVSRAKIAYVASGCVGVRRTTGQHPGGIVVVPKEYTVYDFMPIQYPANKEESAWKTTHFDFRSFHDTLLKLDLLGHVDPVALKMMADLTNIDVKTIPMNDVRVLSLFSSIDALGMKHNYLNQKNGALAIPEYGTDFVRGMLESTNPKSFSDLVTISGLSHGTNVWNGNAEKLIQDKITDLRGVIGCRDDIMTYLISKGITPSVAFAIMEDVRHGYGVKEEYEKVMLANNVPQYYIDSCNKIEYMFPKGHATAYVMMAIRVGYFKVYYPLEFYAVFFSVRSDQWDIESMIKGETAIIAKYEELRAKSRSKFEKLSPKEEEIIKTLTVAIEMVQRGYKFENINLYKSDATKFVVNHENKSLIPPFIVLDGLGENAAKSVVEARSEGEFLSKEDLLRRTKLNGTNVKDLTSLGVLDGLSENDQLSLFDFGF
jgi:DNA polymerase-3 subunit alpha (Gram-positive type)